jgi:O-antigen ligase
MVDRILLLTLLLAPLLLGSNRPVFWAINGASASILLSWLAFRLWRDPKRFGWSALVLLLTASCTTLMLVWMGIQTVGLTPRSWHHPLWEVALGANGSASIDPSLTLSTIGWTATLSIILVAIAKGSDVPFVLRFMRLAAGTASAVAFFGLLVGALGIPTLGVAAKNAYLGWLTGTFVNRNSAATFFSFGMTAALVLATWPARNLLPSRKRPTRFLRAFHWQDPQTPWLAVAIFLFIAVVMTGSRGGLIATVVSLAAFFAVWVVKLRKFGTFGAATLLVMVALCTFSVTVLAGAGIFDRPDAESSTNVRISLYREALRAIRDRPLLGHGAGTYATVQPLYHSSATPEEFVWNRAHSSYLEAAMTLGIPATAIVLAVSVLVLVWMIRALARSREPNPALIAAPPIATMAAVHSFVDFSLQMQAIALYFVIFAGLAIGAAADARHRQRSRRQLGKDPSRHFKTLDIVVAAATAAHPPRSARLAHSAGLLVVVLAGVTLLSNLRIAIVELATPPQLWLASLRPYTPYVGSTSPATALGLQVGRPLRDPFAIYSQALECQRLELVTPRSGFRTPERLARCLAEIDDALRLSPATGPLWLKRAALLRDLQGSSPGFYAAILNSYQVARHTRTLKPARLALALQFWGGLPSDLSIEVAREMEALSAPSIAAIAAAYVRYPDTRGAIDSGLTELATEPLRQEFAQVVKRQSDRVRRSEDRMRTAASSESCGLACDKTVSLRLLAVGETFVEPPAFRLWIDGYPRPTRAVTSALDVQGGRWVSWSDPALAASAQAFDYELPPLFHTIEVEFINDSWDPEHGWDRNLGIVAAEIDGESLPMSCFHVPDFYEDDVLNDGQVILFIRNGAVRLERRCIE